jgi:hypothetical protein
MELSEEAAEIDVREARKWKAEYKATRGRRSSHSVPTHAVTLLPLFRKKAPRDIYSRGLLGVIIL